MSTELLGARGDVVEEHFDAEACNCDENHQKRDNKQQRYLPNEREEKLQQLGRRLRLTQAGDSGLCGPETPVSRLLFVDLAENPAQIPQIRVEIGKIGG